jgi:hypothetical protein
MGCRSGLIRIGEAAYRVPAELLDRFAAQPWRQIVDMRNFAATGTTTSTCSECGAPSSTTFPACALTLWTR